MFAESEVIWLMIVCRQEIFLEVRFTMLQTYNNQCKEAQCVDGEILGKWGSAGSMLSMTRKGMCVGVAALALALASSGTQTHLGGKACFGS